MAKIKSFFQKILTIAFVVILFIILFLGYFYACPNKSDEFNKIYTYIDNQTISILVGFIGLFISYKIWEKQHKKELKDKYFTEYIDAIYHFVAIKKEEADSRKGANRRFNEINDENDERLIGIHKQLSELNRQEIQNEGLIKSRKFLLRELNDERWQKPDEIKSDFGKKYKEFSKKPVVGKNALKSDVYQEAVNCINTSIDEILEKLEKL